MLLRPDSRNQSLGMWVVFWMADKRFLALKWLKNLWLGNSWSSPWFYNLKHHDMTHPIVHVQLSASACWVLHLFCVRISPGLGHSVYRRLPHPAVAPACVTVMATDSDTGGQGDCLQTDFDSLFLTDEADKNALVAKQQQLSYIRSDGGSTPHSRGSPARRNQVNVSDNKTQTYP